jgi:hypothetical protein
MSVSFRTFLPDIIPYVEGCSNIMAERALLLAARTFYNDAQVWRVQSTEATVVGTGNYSITGVPSEIAGVRGVAIDGQPLTQVGDLSVLPLLDTTGRPTHFVVEEDHSVTLYPTPGAVYEIHINGFARPALADTSLPDSALEYYEALVALTLARLFLIPGKPFTNPELAAGYAAIGSGRVDQLRARSQFGGYRAPRTASQFF